MRRSVAFLHRNLLELTSYKSAFILDTAAILFQILTFFFIGKLIPESVASEFIPSKSAYFPFVLLGITFSLYQATALQSLTGALAREQESGTLEMILVTTPIWTILTAGFLWNLVFTTLRVILYLLVGFILFKPLKIHFDPFAFITAIILTLSSLMGFGFFSAGYYLKHKRGDPISFFMNGISKFLSGIFFPIAVLPIWAQKISLLLPLAHALRAIRGVLLEGLTFGELSDQFFILIIFTGLLLPSGILYFIQSYRKACREGNLGYE